MSPVLESAPKPASRFSSLLGACKVQRRVFCNKFWISWFDGLPFRINTTYMVGAFPNIQYHISEKEVIRGKKWVFFLLWKCSLIGIANLWKKWGFMKSCKLKTTPLSHFEQQVRKPRRGFSLRRHFSSKELRRPERCFITVFHFLVQHICSLEEKNNKTK